MIGIFGNDRALGRSFVKGIFKNFDLLSDPIFMILRNYGITKTAQKWLWFMIDDDISQL